MDILFTLLSILGQILTTIYIVKKLNNIPSNKWFWISLLSSIAIFIIGTTSFVIFTNFFLVLTVIIYCKIEKIELDFWHLIYTSVLSVLLVSLLSYFIYLPISHIFVESYAYFISINLCAILIGIIIKFEGLHRIYFVDLVPSRVFIFVTSTFGIFTFFQIQSKASLLFFHAALFIIINILVYMLGNFLSDLKITRLHQENQMKYLEELELLNDELSTFKHDYINLLLSMKESIDNDNLEEVKKIFYDTIYLTKDSILYKRNNIEKYTNIKVLEIRNLIMTKEFEAKQNQCEFSLLTIGNIQDIEVNLVDLIRCISILLDNAIEAAKKNSNCNKVSICLTKVGSEFSFSCRNSISSIKFDREKFFDKQYTTKTISSKNNGIGLFSLKRIIDTHPEITLSTEFKDEYIIQTLLVSLNGQC